MLTTCVVRETRVSSVERCIAVRYGTVEDEGMENAREALEWETEVGVRVGVRNRLGEAIGKPVANLHGRVGQRRVLQSAEKRPKRPSSGFQQTDWTFPNS